MLKFKQFMEQLTRAQDHEDGLHDAATRLNAFVGHLRSPTSMNGKDSTFTTESVDCDGCRLDEVSLVLPPRAGASSSGDRHHESNDSAIADHLNAHPSNIAALVHKDEGANNATHVYDHKHNRFHKIHDGDQDDAIEQNPDGSSGGVRGLKIKGGSAATKEAAGAFVHHATDNPAPDHPDGKGIKRVLELNRATHNQGAERPEQHQEKEHKAARKEAAVSRKADAARPANMSSHPAMNGGNSAEHEQHARILHAGHDLGQSIGNVHAHLQAGYGKVADKMKSDPDYDPRKDKELSSAARKTNKEHARSHGYSAASPRKFLGGNTKIEKNNGVQDMTTGMSNAPAHTHGVAGHNSCPQSSKECRGSCLGFATGKNAMLSNLNSKMSKSQYMIKHPEHHAHQVVSELLNHVDKVHKHNQAVEAGTAPPDDKGQPAKKMNASWRPNMYTDHPPGTLHLHAIHNHVRRYAAARGIEFSTRDYTKNSGTLKKANPDGYHVAASSTGPDIKG